MEAEKRRHDTLSNKDLDKLVASERLTMTAGAYESALLAKLIYYAGDEGNPIPSENKQYFDHVEQEFGFKMMPGSLRTEYIDKVSGYKYPIVRMAVFTNGNPDPKKYKKGDLVVLACCGTKVTSWSDLKQDLTLAFGGEGSVAILQQTRDSALYLMENFNANFTVGHSLGGYCTQMLSTTYGLPGFAFQSPGVLGPYYSVGGTNINGLAVINSEFDALGNFNWPNYTHRVPPLYVRLFNSQTDSAFAPSNHSIMNMIQWFNQQEIRRMNITNRNYMTMFPTYSSQALTFRAYQAPVRFGFMSDVVLARSLLFFKKLLL